MCDSEKNIIYKTILSKTIQIQPEIYPFNSLKLSPNDCIMSMDHFAICCIYFYDIHQWSFYRQKSNEEFMNVDRLILSLSKLIEYYPVLAGAFKIDEKDKTTSIVFDNDNDGIIFNSVSVNIPLSDLSLSINEYTNTMTLDNSLELTNKIDSHTLFHVRHTRFLCGGVALAIQLNHRIGDAHSYFQFVKDWARMYHDIEYRPIVSHKRSLLERSLQYIETHKHSWPNFNKQDAWKVYQETSSPVEQTIQSITKIFRFSADELERMKNEATAHLPPEIHYVSTFDVLTAHLYRHVAIARESSHSSYITKLFISTDIRSRIKQPIIPSTYFGNAVLFSYLERESEDLIRINDLGYWAGQVHQAIAAKTSDEIETTLAWIICQPDKSKIVPTCNPIKTDFLITAWNKLGMYSDSDFELGIYPCRIHLPLGQMFNGAAILCSTEKNDNSIDVTIGLNIKTMEQLENNIDFRKYRSN